jgi:alpha-beta hydrolase superfamily lysophospholipase
MRSLEKELARHLPHFLQALHVPTGLNPEHLSHDKEEVELYRNDPLVHGWITPAAYLAMEKSMRGLYRVVPRIDTPLLFLLSGKDRVVDTEAAEAFAAKLAVAHPGQVEVRIFHTFFHEPFHEAKRERAFLEWKKWTLKCLTPRKPSSSRSSKKKAIGKAISL